MPKNNRDAEYQAHVARLECAEDCVLALTGFASTARLHRHDQKPIPQSVKDQLLVLLDSSRPVMDVLSAGAALPAGELMAKLRHAGSVGTGLEATREAILYEEFLPLVNSVLPLVEGAVRRYRRRYRLPAENHRTVVTVRLADPAPAEELPEDHPTP
ncbi:hypothetical protein Asp14428_02910 [Actinoplanes sp. NBRC 14428]|nr:hypothetical protein Asp14428_02910 [Actinoplanes sp. NBRC 14428]